MADANVLIQMIGFPSSGKSTQVKELLSCLPFAPYHDLIVEDKPIVIETDNVRYYLHGERFIPEREPEVWEIARVACCLALDQCMPVIIDATGINREERKKWLDVADRFVNANTVGVWVDTPEDVLVERLTERSEEEGIDWLPILEKMKARWETPSEEEGFDHLIRVRSSGPKPGA